MKTRLEQIRFTWLLAFATAMLLIGCQEKAKENDLPWISLFDGQTLNGWNIKGGNASYEVKDGTIVGTSALNTRNTFLCSDQTYGDFILELEYKVDPKLNSGIQIRSNSIPSYRNGVVHGYQIEIDPSDRAWSAGIYDEQRRDWLVNLADNPLAQKAFRQNEWNSYRIEAIGDTLKTWINGVEAAHLIDDMTASGFIGLQVHSIEEAEKEGTQVVWKNIRILTENPNAHARAMSLPARHTMNRILYKEEKDGWKLLWDGQSTDGWRGDKLDKFPEHGWEIKDGLLSVVTTGGAQSADGGDIVTNELYGDFEFKVDFKISEGANSGIKYYVDTELNKGEGSAIGLEYQILDDAVHEDAKLGSHVGSRTMGSLYDLIQADPDKVVNPVGQWNYAHIISRNNHVEHWLNGRKILEYERKSDDFRKLVQESKYKIWPDFGEADEGNILLQEHGTQVSFRNIKVRPLDNQTK